MFYVSLKLPLPELHSGGIPMGGEEVEDQRKLGWEQDAEMKQQR